MPALPVQVGVEWSCRSFMYMVNTAKERSRRIRRTSYVAVGAWVLVALACYASYQSDRAELRAIAREITTEVDAPAERVVRLVRWVHGHTGSRQSESYFAWRGLGATSVQVLRQGGDCADKSRLLSALLSEVDVPSTPALCFDAQTKKPTHTVVEASLGQGRFMVVDPAYGLYFPRDDGGYYDLLDIRRDPAIVDRRVEEIYASLPSPGEHDRYYLRSSSSYELGSTFNWHKSSMTRLALATLKPLYGESIYRLPRPAFLESPKLFVASLNLGLAVASWVIGWVVSYAITRATGGDCSASGDGMSASLSSGGDVGVSVAK